MSQIAEFVVKITGVSDKKKLKAKSKTYTYGAFSIRSQKLTEHIGQELTVKVFVKNYISQTHKRDKGKKHNTSDKNE